MPDIFSKIISGEIPSHKIASSGNCFAFLDINPLKPGHCLCVHKDEIADLFAMSSVSYMELLSFTHKVAQALQDAIPCERVTLTVLGFEIPHAHIHLIPVNNEAEANFKNTRIKCTPSELENVRKKIAYSYSSLFSNTP